MIFLFSFLDCCGHLCCRFFLWMTKLLRSKAPSPDLSVAMKPIFVILTMTCSFRRWRQLLLLQVGKIFLTFMGTWTVVLVISLFSLTRIPDASNQILIFSNSTWRFNCGCFRNHCESSFDRGYCSAISFYYLVF